MKYRIKIEEYSNKTLYIPEYKKFFKWKPIVTKVYTTWSSYYKENEFYSLEKAKIFIKNLKPKISYEYVV